MGQKHPNLFGMAWMVTMKMHSIWNQVARWHGKQAKKVRAWQATMTSIHDKLQQLTMASYPDILPWQVTMIMSIYMKICLKFSWCHINLHLRQLLQMLLPRFWPKFEIKSHVGCSLVSIAWRTNCSSIWLTWRTWSRKRRSLKLSWLLHGPQFFDLLQDCHSLLT